MNEMNKLHRMQEEEAARLLEESDQEWLRLERRLRKEGKLNE